MPFSGTVQHPQQAQNKASKTSLTYTSKHRCRISPTMANSSPPTNATAPPLSPLPTPTPTPETMSSAPSSTTPMSLSPPPPPSPMRTSLSPPPPPPSGDGKLPTGTLVGMIVGIGIGGMGMLVAVGFFFIFYRKWKRKKMREQGFDNYHNSGGAPPLQDLKNGPSGGPPQKLQNNCPPDDTKVAMNPIPSPAAEFMSSYPPPSASNSSGSEKPPPPHSPAMVLGLSQSAFTYEELARATENFSSANLVGQGGFGYVHKGVLPNGKEVAVKQLKAGSGQGEREFRAEVEVIGRVHHRHLVSLVGYCVSGAQKMLVYEFVPNSTLEFHLHGEGRPTMNWPTRMKIALGSAKGLAYLHEDCQPKIIHRDIKAANILLDDEFEAKVADFGLAKFSFDTDTHVSTRVMGTFGYLAPEYAASGKLTEKSDVFSFGVVLLELITGCRPINKTHSFTDDSMVEWARPLLMQALDKGNFDGLVDTKLQNDYNSDEMTRMVSCAAACVRHSARLRPRMSQILRALEGNIPLDDLNEGIKPGHSTVYSSFGSQHYNTRQYNEDMKNFRKLALESQELGTTEYSGHSTESGGLHPSASSTSESQQTTMEIEPEKIKKHTESPS